jgi:hypothetical protein
LDGTGRVAHIDPATFALVGSFSLGNSSSGPWVATDLEVQPGTTDTLAVSLAPYGVTAIYDAGVPRPDTTRYAMGPNRIEFADESTLFGTDNSTSDFAFYRLSVTGNGPQISATSPYIFQRYGIDIE